MKRTYLEDLANGDVFILASSYDDLLKKLTNLPNLDFNVIECPVYMKISRFRLGSLGGSSITYDCVSLRQYSACSLGDRMEVVKLESKLSLKLSK
jgi:hypothetical protein